MRMIRERIVNFFSYLPLLRELVGKEIKTRYRRSILGYMWSLLNPLLMMLVISAVFSYLFKYSIEHYNIYLIIGQTFYGFLSESTNHAMTALIYSRVLLQKIYVPKYIFPLAKVLSSFVNLLYSMLAIGIVIFVTGTPLSSTIFLFPLGLLYIFLFCTGLGLALSILAVYFRDMLHLYTLVLTAWMYLTPIFYSVDSLSPLMASLIKWNPLYMYITFFRKIIIWGQLPSLSDNLHCLFWSVLAMSLGLIFFKRNQDNIVLYF